MKLSPALLLVSALTLVGCNPGDTHCTEGGSADPSCDVDRSEAPPLKPNTPSPRSTAHRDAFPSPRGTPKPPLVDTASEDNDDSSPEVLPEVSLQCDLTFDGGLPPGKEGEFLRPNIAFEGQRSACAAAQHAAAGARASVLEATLVNWGGEGPVLLSIRNLHGGVLAETTLDGGGGSLTVALSTSGEFFVRLEPLDPSAPDNSYALAMNCVEGCDLEYTRHPIVLLHGIGGTDAFGDGEYFEEVEETLEPLGYAVHVPTVSAFSTPPKRAKEWEAALEDLRAQGLGRRFNLIAHSQAGLDARYLIATLGRHALISSLVTISTPHYGTELADILVGLIENDPSTALWVNLATAGFSMLFGIQGEDTSLTGALESLTTPAAAAFNAQNPDHPDVYYASWSAMTCGMLEFSCQSSCEGSVVHPALEATYVLMRINGLENDGMVPRTSGIWADHRGKLCADHGDQVGLFPHEDGEGFDHLNFHLEEFRRLADLQH
jgi:triacylglycerol lipase